MKQRVVWACAEEAQKLAEAEDREKTGVKGDGEMQAQM